MPPQRNMRAADVNPCLEESAASTNCMDSNGYQRDRCASYFNKYKQCRKFWHTIMLKRRGDGVSPAMPTAEERKQILASLDRLPY
ncbi:coiled-coil-helix-coiled-coil-helix domain-containing protein 7 [Hyla sarda]|uniref:coiled-coil-helix-coiled-coil-helix domain-containing protein 7 n=1 Tax=Hyla sarda TaxID=327740 RepID=UPI0024C41FD4|nr:coiled-coil-helix-coiled-coil-helix domain-containing protein 7 [Hyla sarda]XP_056377948.1 coiled-coil-helix-coiled-coil-helix domain-containing protein 7 [Hyla sarda]